jgi:hypothetical protein
MEIHVRRIKLSTSSPRRNHKHFVFRFNVVQRTEQLHTKIQNQSGNKHISIDAESKHLSNESDFIEIGQKLIELWRWKVHVFPLQLVFQNVFFDF